MNNTFTFTLKDEGLLGRFCPRIGTLVTRNILVETPGLITFTSRTLVSHLSRDHVQQTAAIKLINVPFETFLDKKPPLPLIQQCDQALHTFLGYSPEHHILSLTLRDPSDVRILPPNGQKFVNAACIRGVRQVTPEEWKSYLLACKPDFVHAISDTPFTPPPFSQKRITKNIERSTAWLANLLQPIPPTRSPELGGLDDSTVTHPLNVFVQMAGCSSEAARRAFAQGLVEKLYGSEANQISPLECYDDGICGYAFDMEPLSREILSSTQPDLPSNKADTTFPLAHQLTASMQSQRIALIKASLEPLKSGKPRIVNSVATPHEMLNLICEVGIDIFDAAWAQQAADWGVALDFAFPVPEDLTNSRHPRLRDNGKRDLGHNLYDSRYTMDFSSFASCFSDGYSSDGIPDKLDSAIPCMCVACSPRFQRQKIRHSSLDVHEDLGDEDITCSPAFTRAYVHHLLHTHEMLAHALLVAHNVTVLDNFFRGVRTLLSSHKTQEQSVVAFKDQVRRFCATYDDSLVVFKEARHDWIDVDLARGKGRLSREKAKLEHGDV